MTKTHPTKRRTRPQEGGLAGKQAAASRKFMPDYYTVVINTQHPHWGDGK